MNFVHPEGKILLNQHVPVDSDSHWVSKGLQISRQTGAASTRKAQRQLAGGRLVTQIVRKEKEKKGE